MMVPLMWGAFGGEIGREVCNLPHRALARQISGDLLPTAFVAELGTGSPLGAGHHAVGDDVAGIDADDADAVRQAAGTQGPGNRHHRRVGPAAREMGRARALAMHTDHVDDNAAAPRLHQGINRLRDSGGTEDLHTPTVPPFGIAEIIERSRRHAAGAIDEDIGIRAKLGEGFAGRRCAEIEGMDRHLHRGIRLDLIARGLQVRQGASHEMNVAFLGRKLLGAAEAEPLRGAGKKSRLPLQS